MNRKSIGKKLLFPPIWLMVILVMISAAALSLVYIKGVETSPIAYVVYVISFYTISVVSLFCVLVLPKQYKDIENKIYNTSLGNRYMTDAVFRTHVSLYISLSVNMLYVGMNLFSYYLYRSMWFVILAGYYVILAVMRFLLVRYARKIGIGKNRLGELKRSRLCSCMLLTVNFVLPGAVLMILYQDKGFEYHGILIYVMAAYTFYITTHAIISLVKYRKYKSPVMTTAHIISLSAALVSMLSLETAMFSQFGAEMSPQNQRLTVALTGAGVSITVITMSLYMIIKTANEIKDIRKSEHGR